MTLIEPRFRGLFLSVFALFTLFGTSMTIIGATLPKILANFHWNYLTAGIVLGAGAVAYFVSTFVAGYLVKHWGSKPTILLALTLIVAGLAFFATTPDPGSQHAAERAHRPRPGRRGSWPQLDDPADGRAEHWSADEPFAWRFRRWRDRWTVRGQHADAEWPRLGRRLPRHGGDLRAAGLLIAFAALPSVRPKAAEHDETRERLSANPAYRLSFFALFLYLGVELGVSNWVAEYFVVVFAYSPDASADARFAVLAGRIARPLRRALAIQRLAP